MDIRQLSQIEQGVLPLDLVHLLDAGQDKRLNIH
jgi:hypothetical protein